MKSDKYPTPPIATGPKPGRFWGRILLLGLLLGSGIGFITGFWMPPGDDDIFFAIKKNLTIFGALYEELSVGYVDEVNPESFLRIGVGAMLESLDPYTVFIDEADNEEIDIVVRGHYAGVGLSVGKQEDGRITVITPIEGYSAFKQGVRVGDIITHIDDKALQGLDPDQVTTLLRGDAGSTVHLRIEREGEPEPIDFILTRSDVRLKSVSYAGYIDADSTLGYVRLERFTRQTVSEVRTAIKDLTDTGTLQGFVLDLRNNPGGLVDAAVDIAGLFIGQGEVVVSTRGRLPQTDRIYRNRRPPLLPDLPVVLLVNESSASASEIVAGALQDLDRAVVVGVPTFGKGLVQIIRPLPYNTSLKMTTSKYYTPSGRSIQSIQYTHRKEDGYAVAMPDSLRDSFSTVGGRDVRSGGGIEPDLVSRAPEHSELETALLRKSAFFLFANSFAGRLRTQNGTSIDETFEVSDTVYEEFQAWLTDQDFSYRTRTEIMMDALSDRLVASAYRATNDEMDALRRAVAKEKSDDFARHKRDLRERLRAEILARFFGETAQIRAALSHDPQVEDAQSILRDTNRYNNILTGN